MATKVIDGRNIKSKEMIGLWSETNLVVVCRWKCAECVCACVLIKPEYKVCLPKQKDGNEKVEIISKVMQTNKFWVS